MREREAVGRPDQLVGVGAVADQVEAEGRGVAGGRRVRQRESESAAREREVAHGRGGAEPPLEGDGVGAGLGPGQSDYGESNERHQSVPHRDTPLKTEFKLWACKVMKDGSVRAGRCAESSGLPAETDPAGSPARALAWSALLICRDCRVARNIQQRLLRIYAFPYI